MWRWYALPYALWGSYQSRLRAIWETRYLTKIFVEMYYGPGEIGERQVYRGSTGSQGNCINEKKLIYEVGCLLLCGHDRQRKLMRNAVRVLKKAITVKLDRRKLDNLSSGVADSTTRLLNGYHLCIAAMSRVQHDLVQRPTVQLMLLMKNQRRIN